MDSDEKSEITPHVDYFFAEELLNQIFTISVDRQHAQPQDRVWLQYVAWRYSSRQLAFACYRRRFVRSGPLFSSRDFDGFDAHVEQQRQQMQDNAEMLAKCEITERASADKCLKAGWDKSRGERKKGATTFKRKADAVAATVFEEGNDVAFKSDRSRDALRTMLLSKPTTVAKDSAGDLQVSGCGSEERRTKRRVYEGLAMPAPSPVRVERARQRANIEAIAIDLGLTFLVRMPDGGALVEQTVLPEPAEGLVGVWYSFKKQLERCLKHAVQTNTASERYRKPSAFGASANIVLQCLLGADGVTPVNKGVVGIGVRLLDPSRLLFLEGASPMLRFLVAWGPESDMPKLATLRNQKLSAICNERTRLNSALECTVELKGVSEDNKGAQIEVGKQSGSMERRCVLCTCAAASFSSYHATELTELSIHDSAAMYLRSLHELLTFIDEHADTHSKKPLQHDSESFLAQRVQAHGVRTFPLLVVANARALSDLRDALCSMMALGDRFDALSAADQGRARVRFRRLILLDAQLQSQPPVSVGAVTGFSLKGVFPNVTSLHGTHAWGRSLLLDVVERSVASGAARNELRDQLLSSVSGSTKSYFDHFPSYAVRLVLLNESAFASVPKAVQQLRSLFVRLFCTPYLESPSQQEIAALAVCSFAADSVVEFLLPRRYNALADAHEEKDLSSANTLWKHGFQHSTAQMLRYSDVPQHALTEDGVESMVSRPQQYLRDRGSGRADSLVSEALAHIATEDAKAEYNLPSRYSPATKARAKAQLSRGLLFVGPAAAVVETAFDSAVRRFGTLGLYFRKVNGRLAVCDPELNLERPMDALAADVDVMCLCEESEQCDHDFDADW